jgi:hypothetical protein
MARSVPASKDNKPVLLDDVRMNALKNTRSAEVFLGLSRGFSHMTSNIKVIWALSVRKIHSRAL